MTPAAAVAAAPAQNTWHALPAEAVLAQLGSTDAGLSSQEAAQRLAAGGANELKEAKPVSAAALLAGQFKSLIIWVLIGAGVVSGILGEGVDCAAILAIVVLNAGIGFYQEFKAGKSIAALKKLTAPMASVRRDGQVVSISASQVVAGDILLLEAGDLVAADARLLEAASLRCMESALTGESGAVSKRAAAMGEEIVALADRENMVFMGASVAAGAGRAVVVACGMGTELGRIAGLIEEAGGDETTPLQQRLAAFGRLLVWAALGIVALLFGLGLMRGTPPLELFMTSVSLAVAAVPEGLPAVVTVALALGVLRMSRRRALVRALPAVETLGSTTVICTDKTGTLTLGQMTVRAFYVGGQTYEVTGEGYGPEGEVRFEGQKAGAQHAAALLELGTVLVGCNSAHRVQDNGVWSLVGDPTEGAMLAAGPKAGASQERLDKEMPKLAAIPFDSDRKRSTVIRKAPEGTTRAFVNGAPGPLLERCTSFYSPAGIRPLTDADRQHILAQTAAMAKNALRVLGSARRDLGAALPAGPAAGSPKPGIAGRPEDPGGFTAESVERDLVFVGLTGMYDPPRPEAKEAVAKCRGAGIRVVMITGDHPDTATAIARELGIASGEDTALSGVELDRLNDAQLRERAPKTAVYARVTAEHKLRIIRAWKAGGAVVAMTGDGVNDAPAIKGADIGIAMGKTGTEVTKQASDMIVTDDNFASIVAAVEEGRGIYDNIRKTLQYLLAGNTGELLLMTACVVLGLPAPLVPVHLLWINLVTDGLPALCLATDPIDPGVMKRPPRPPAERLTDPVFLRAVGLTGLLTAGVAFAVYYYVLGKDNLATARGYAFAVLVFAELLRSFGARSETQPLWRIPFFTNLNLAIVVAVSCGLQVWSQHNGTLERFLKTSFMPWTDCLWLLAAGSIPLLVLEGVKALSQSRRKPGPPRHGAPPPAQAG